MPSAAGLRDIGWNVPDSHGSMFVWAPLPGEYTDSMAFLPGPDREGGRHLHPRPPASSPSGEGYVRFALTMPVERIQAAVQAIAHSGILD